MRWLCGRPGVIALERMTKINDVDMKSENIMQLPPIVIIK
jgi:hypothetical protein